MVRKKNEEILILGLLFLALLGKGPLGTPGTTPDPTRPGTPDPMRPGGDMPKGMDPSNPGGGMPKGQDPNPTGGSGAPDKGKPMSPPGMGPMNPGFTPAPYGTLVAPPSTPNRINPVAPMGGIMIGPSTFFVPGLDLFGGMGGPGAGPYTPSITSKYGSTTYTNANLREIAANLDAHNLSIAIANGYRPPVAQQEAMKQSVPPMSMPPMMAPMMQSIPQGMVNPQAVPFMIPFQNIPVIQPVPNPPGPYVNPTIQNPLPQPTPWWQPVTNFFSGLIPGLPTTPIPRPTIFDWI